MKNQEIFPTSDIAKRKIENFRQDLQGYLQEEHKIRKSHTFAPKAEEVFANNPMTLDEYALFLKQEILPFTVNIGHRKFIGHMTTQIPDFLAKIGELLVTLNQNVVKVETSDKITGIERLCLANLHSFVFQQQESFYHNFLQNPNVALGTVTSNGSLANTMAMWVARNKSLDDAEVNCSEDGLFACLRKKGYNDAVIICSSLAHYSVDKSASLIGLGKRNVVKIPVDNEGRILLPELRRKIVECHKKNIGIIAIWGIAGTTELGSVDDLVELGQIAREYGIHFHVDAAWGGILTLSKEYRKQLTGIENADSVTICGHKQFLLPQGISFVLHKNIHDMKWIETQTRYQARNNSFDLGRWTIEGSRPANILYFHAALHCIGVEGYNELMRESMEKTSLFVTKIQQRTDFELVQLPQMNIVSYRYLPEYFSNSIDNEKEHEAVNDLNEQIQKQMWQNGNSFVSRTIVSLPKYHYRPTTVFRAVIINPHTTSSDLDEILNEQQQIAESLLQTAQVC